jgi:hypothetical protein
MHRRARGRCDGGLSCGRHVWSKSLAGRHLLGRDETAHSLTRHYFSTSSRQRRSQGHSQSFTNERTSPPRDPLLLEAAPSAPRHVSSRRGGHIIAQVLGGPRWVDRRTDETDEPDSGWTTATTITTIVRTTRTRTKTAAQRTSAAKERLKPRPAVLKRLAPLTAAGSNLAHTLRVVVGVVVVAAVVVVTLMADGEERPSDDKQFAHTPLSVSLSLCLSPSLRLRLRAGWRLGNGNGQSGSARASGDETDYLLRKTAESLRWSRANGYDDCRGTSLVLVEKGASVVN